MPNIVMPSALVSRLLPPAEWGRLSGRELATVLPHVPERDVQIVVIEDGDQIVAYQAVLRLPFLGGLWVDPAYRHRPGIWRPLVSATWQAVHRWTDRWAFTFTPQAMTPFVVEHFATVPIEGHVFFVAERETSSCRS